MDGNLMGAGAVWILYLIFPLFTFASQAFVAMQGGKC